MKNRRILETLAKCETPSKFVDDFLDRLRKLSDEELDSEWIGFQGRVMVEIGYTSAEVDRVVLFKFRSIEKVVNHLKEFVIDDNASVSKIIIRQF